MAEIAFDEEVDITDKVCPLTFVKAKVAIDELDEGQIIAIRMKDGEPVQNVPRSIKDEGHQILKLADNEDGEPHVISYDDYKDRADIYPWVLNCKGDSRVHAWNFIQTVKGVRILIADFNLDIVIPNAKLTRRREGGRK